MQWSRDSGSTQIRLNNVAFSNPDMAGNLSGSHRWDESGPGTMDLTGHLTRADARHVVRYIPITVAKGSRPWMASAFVAGQSNDVRFQVQGDLAKFPFPDNKGGTFFVVAKVTGGTLHYADGWQRIENIEGDSPFEASAWTSKPRGLDSGRRLHKVQAEFADPAANEKVLVVK